MDPIDTTATAVAVCRDCGWETDVHNAVAFAALAGMHTERTGHHVTTHYFG